MAPCIVGWICSPSVITVIWAPKSCRLFLTPNEHTCDIHLAVSPRSIQGQYLAVGTHLGLVQIWDAAAEKKTCSISGHTGRVGEAGMQLRSLTLSFCSCFKMVMVDAPFEMNLFHVRLPLHVTQVHSLGMETFSAQAAGTTPSSSGTPACPPCPLASFTDTPTRSVGSSGPQTTSSLHQEETTTRCV